VRLRLVRLDLGMHDEPVDQALRIARARRAGAAAAVVLPGLLGMVLAHPARARQKLQRPGRASVTRA
jgi:hypothetical protein